MSEKALFDENLTKVHGLEHIIRTRLLGVDPDEQDVRLDDDDWRAILAALDALKRIAEGNLGDDPWQANYARIKQVASEAIEQTGPASQSDRP